MWARVLLIAAPFVLIALGGWCLVGSSLPAILRLVLRGQHLYAVEPTWRTLGLPLAALACWGGAVWLSLAIGPSREKAPDKLGD